MAKVCTVERYSQPFWVIARDLMTSFHLNFGLHPTNYDDCNIASRSKDFKT